MNVRTYMRTILNVMVSPVANHITARAILRRSSASVGSRDIIRGDEEKRKHVEDDAAWQIDMSSVGRQTDDDDSDDGQHPVKFDLPGVGEVEKGSNSSPGRGRAWWVT